VSVLVGVLGGVWEGVSVRVGVDDGGLEGVSVLVGVLKAVWRE